ncbi:MAG TPA: flagellar hook-associated protein FlgK [Actinobacteria bacterium]|nr:flagellar hook-associated protein FlgK [Actinomycetota bacterium]
MSIVGLYSAYSALQAAQAGLDTTSHNVANAGTDGYTRQRVELQARRPYASPNGPIGTGVDVADIARARDRFADQRVWLHAEANGRFSAKADLLAAMDEVTMEPDGGVSVALADLWTSFEQLALDPTDQAARIEVLGSLEGVALRVRELATNWNAKLDEARSELGSVVDEVDRLLGEVARLNVEILDVGTAGSPNDLLDTRDRLLDRLTELAGVTVTDGPSGTVRVSLDGLSLVDGANVHTLSVGPGDTVVHAAGVSLTPGGRLAGLTEFLTVDAPAVLASLDAFAVDLATAVNTTHAAGYAPSGAAGGPLFSYTPGDAAATFSVAISDPRDLAAAQDPGPPVPAFDGRNAQALADLRDQPVALGGTTTIDGAFRRVVTELAGRTRRTRDGVETTGRLLDSSRALRESRRGVSLDEEMANLLQYQRSYEAAARVMTAVDQLLDTLVNRTGIVGR